MRRSTTRLAAAVLIVMVGAAAAACDEQESASRSTFAPLVPRDSLPSITAAPSTTVAAALPALPIIPAFPSDLECAFTPAPSTPVISFILFEQVYEVTADGSALRCLAKIRTDQRGPLQWSPLGDEALVSGANVLDENGTRQTGFDSSNRRMQWSPDGLWLLGPTTSSRTLVRRDPAGANRSEVTFLARTDLAIYHPSGTALIGAGLAGDGTSGLFITDETGQDRIPLMLLDPAVTAITDLAVDAGGDQIYLARSRGDSFVVERLSLPDLTTVQLGGGVNPIGAMTAGPTPGAIAWREGLCNATTQVRAWDDAAGESVVVGEGTELGSQSATPVGWLDSARLVVVGRPIGCDGPGDLWIWNILDRSITLVLRPVEWPTLRGVGTSTATLPTGITAATTTTVAADDTESP